MLNRVLVTYGSRYGSTQEVAKVVAEILRDHGIAVDFRAANEIKSLEPYATIILGAPLYIGRWHGDAHQFLDDYQDALAKRDVAIFALGPLTTSSTEMKESQAQLNRELESYSWLEPVAVKVFIGKFDPVKLNGFHKRLAFSPDGALYQLPVMDNRDWEDIHEWASELSINLVPNLS